MKKVEFFDTDFLGNKIEIGDKVILETPKYRDFAIGTVISKAPKSCQVEYLSFCTKSNVTVRQYYEQLIKYPITKEGKWEKHYDGFHDMVETTCSNCLYTGATHFKYCPNCAASTPFTCVELPFIR